MKQPNDQHHRTRQLNMMKKIPSFPRSGECACYTVLDLFSGIGGFSLGLTRAGFRTTAFCEIEEYPRSILRKHWPDVPIFEDVRKLHAADLPEPVTVICGGYPCQPFSLAGQRKGKDDDRHLWPEIVRIIRELDATTGKPTWCIFENVAGHVSMGLDQVLIDLEAEGYAAWPFIVPACAVNAPHRRDRVWIVAHHAGRTDRRHNPGEVQRQEPQPGKGIGVDVVSASTRQLLDRGRDFRAAGRNELADCRCFVADSDAKHGDVPGLRAGQIPQQQEAGIQQDSFADPQSEQARRVFEPWFSANPESGSDLRGQAGEWITLPGVRARNDGLPGRVARLKALGNAVVPQIPELIGRCIRAV